MGLYVLRVLNLKVLPEELPIVSPGAEAREPTTT